MNPNRFFMPNMAMVNPMRRNYYIVPSEMGLFGRITRGIRSFNWNGLLNGANKTLNVFNQTIPLIRQAKPMFNNMKNMLKIAKAFRNETSHTNKEVVSPSTNEMVTLKKEVNSNNYPNFFI